MVLFSFAEPKTELSTEVGGLQSSARIKKAAISPRVTGRFGQNESAEHPEVMPLVAKEAISAWKK